jgi:hypothetical protein
MKILRQLPFFLLGTGLACAETTVWVSVSGDDARPGTKAAPVASLPRAAELVRKARAAKPADPVTVWLGEGTYVLSESLILGEADSGTATAPVVWRAVERGKARILGARPVNQTQLRPLSDPAVLARLAPEAKGKLLEYNLAANEIRCAAGLPDYQSDPADLCTLFYDGVRLPLSRWPNGQYGYTTMKRVLSSGNMAAGKPDGGVFEYREDRPARWQAGLAEGGVWVRGFWRVPWVAETIRVGAIDPKARTLTLAVSTSKGIGSKYSSLVNGSRVGDGKENWCALNLIEEIDQPGEWAVDFKRGKLYLLPPAAFEPSRLTLADNAQALITFDDARFITLRDLSLGHHIGDGIKIDDGQSVQLLGCALTGVVRRGVVIRGGTGHRIQSCDLSEIGLTGIDLLGGDRKTLKPSGFEVVNNHLWRIALNSPVPALTAGLDAKNQNLVGALVAHNRIHDVSYAGITFGGNDNLFKANEIYRIGLDGGDLGGFYTTGGWTSRGNVVRGNFIHHSMNANAIYMDDGDSGLLMEDNLIYQTASGIFIGGGHDHTAHRNLIVGTPIAFHIDDRGVSRKYDATDRRLRGDLDSVPYSASPWKERYPALVGILQRNPAIPHGNVLTGNFVVGCTTLVRRSGKTATLAGFRLDENQEIPDLGVFADLKTLDFTAKAGSGLPAIALKNYGLQLDEFRQSLPERDLKLLNEGNTGHRTFDSQQDVDASNKKP